MSDQSIKLFQMATAIGGWRLGRGDWQARDSQQAKFAGFDLTSYQRGDLQIDIMPRPLIMQTELEAAQLDLVKAQVAATLPASLGSDLLPGGMAREDVEQ